MADLCKVCPVLEYNECYLLNYAHVKGFSGMEKCELYDTIIKIQNQAKADGAQAEKKRANKKRRLKKCS